MVTLRATSSISELGHHLWSDTPNTSPTTLQVLYDPTSIHFEGAVFHCEDKQSSSLRIYCPCLYYQSIENTFQDPSILKHSKLTQLPPSLPSTSPEKTRKSTSVGGGRWPSTTSRLAQERVPQRTTHHLLRGVTFPTHAQHPGSTYLSTYFRSCKTLALDSKKWSSPVALKN